MKNVIFITIDSLRADHLSCLGYHRKTTPNLDNLAKEGVLFKNAISCGPDTPTSIVPLLTSTYILTYVIINAGLNKSKTRAEEFERIGAITSEIYRNRITIAEILKDSGYVTAAFHSNPFLSRHFYFGKGFDYFYDSFSSSGRFRKYAIKSKIEEILKKNIQLYNFAKNIYNRMHSNNIPYERAEIINKKAISWLKKHKKQFFVWIHYMDVHFPYKPPKRFQLYFRSKPMNNLEMTRLNYKMIHKPEEISENDMRDIIDLYDGEIRYVDYAIKLLLDELSEMNILNDTFIIITADHGEEFGEHGDFAHHHAKLYDEIIRVPLIISNSEYRNVEIDEPVSLLDVAPTILDLLGIPKNESFQGRSLVPIIRGERKSSGVISEGLQKGKRSISYRTKEWKYIFNEVGAQRELYNIECDPKEKKNLYEKEREKAREFELKIKKHLLKQEKIAKGLTREKEKIKRKVGELKSYGKI